ncbi:hypothetical protein ILYODFUR_036176 [Ilyodon furcidens]|uniref:Uncharacterized protein n=1 Tax=Ilyodon furcidens TaxID=33524 RepID=A0ABV0TDZ0_9TELE
MSLIYALGPSSRRHLLSQVPLDSFSVVAGLLDSFSVVDGRCGLNLLAIHQDSLPARDDLPAVHLNSVSARDNLVVVNLNSVPARDDLLAVHLNCNVTWLFEHIVIVHC